MPPGIPPGIPPAPGGGIPPFLRPSSPNWSYTLRLSASLRTSYASETSLNFSVAAALSPFALSCMNNSYSLTTMNKVVIRMQSGSVNTCLSQSAVSVEHIGRLPDGTSWPMFYKLHGTIKLIREGHETACRLTDATVFSGTFFERAFVCILGHSQDTIVILPHPSNHTNATKLVRQTGGFCARHASWLAGSHAARSQARLKGQHVLHTAQPQETSLKRYWGPDQVLICRLVS